MSPDTDRHVVTLQSIEAARRSTPLEISLPEYDRDRFEDVAFMTAMSLVLLGNYSQTGHFGGPLAYTPYNVAIHLGGPAMGGLALRHPRAEASLSRTGSCSPAVTASRPATRSGWSSTKRCSASTEATGDERFRCDPRVGMFGIDALGFRRSPDALERLLPDNGLVDDPLFAQAKLRGIRALAGHSESTDVTNDVNGGPSGVGLSTTAGKAMFWDIVGADPSLKMIALEGEFAMTEGHAQELKTAGARAAGRQASADPAVDEQRRHRRRADRRRRQGALRRLRPREPVGLLRLERLRDRRRQRLRRGLRRPQGDGGLAGGRPAADDPRRSHGEGLVAGGGQRAAPRLRRADRRAIRAIRTPSR